MMNRAEPATSAPKFAFAPARLKSLCALGDRIMAVPPFPLEEPLVAADALLHVTWNDLPEFFDLMNSGLSGPVLQVSWTRVAHVFSSSMVSTIKSSFHSLPSACPGAFSGGFDGSKLLEHDVECSDDDEVTNDGDDDDDPFLTFMPFRLIVSIFSERRKARAPVGLRRVAWWVAGSDWAHGSTQVKVCDDFDCREGRRSFSAFCAGVWVEFCG